MLTIIIRTLLIYAIVTVAVRIMGKRQVSDMQPTELVTTLIISEIAALPLENPERPLLSGLVSIMMLVAVEIIVSLIMLKSAKARGVICGHPILVIRNGTIIDEALKKLRISREDLYSLLRQKDCPDEKEIDYGLIEPDGTLSLLTAQDLNNNGLQSEDLKEELEKENQPEDNEQKEGST